MRRIAIAPLVASALFVAGCPDSSDQPPPPPPQAVFKDDPLLNLPPPPPPPEAAQPVEAPRSQPPEPSLTVVDFGVLDSPRTLQRSLTLRNPGTLPTPLDGIRFPVTLQYSLSGDCIGRSQLGPNDVCSIQVVFQPTAPGSFEDAILIEHPERPSPIRITLRGIVQPPPTPTGPDPRELQRAALRSQSAQEPIQAVAVPPPPEAETRLLNETNQQDWTDQGWARTEASLPVNLEHTILRNTPISATLVETLDTHIGCPARAVVGRHVWGHHPGPKPLIPKGSILEGACAAVGGVSQERLAIFWDRLITPDGRAITLSAPSTGPDGRGGVAGEVETYFWERYARQLLLSVVNAGFVWAFAEDQRSTTTPEGTTVETQSARQQALEQLTEDVRNITNQLARESAQYIPRFIVSKGTPLLVYPTQDIWFAQSRVVAVDTALLRELARRQAAQRVTTVPGSQIGQPLRSAPAVQLLGQEGGPPNPFGGYGALPEQPPPPSTPTPVQPGSAGQLFAPGGPTAPGGASTGAGAPPPLPEGPPPLAPPPPAGNTAFNPAPLPFQVRR